MKTLGPLVATATATATLATLALLAPAARAAAHTAQDCEQPETAKTVGNDYQVRIQALNDQQRATQQQIDGELKRKAQDLHWPQDRIPNLMMQVLGSKEFAGFEKQKQPYMQDLMGAMQAMSAQKGPEDPKATCRFVLKMDAMIDGVKAINEREYAYMLATVRAAK